MKSVEMSCINCLSQQAKTKRPQGVQWLFTPLSWPVRCERCMTNFHAPTLMLVMLWLSDRISGSDEHKGH